MYTNMTLPPDVHPKIPQWIPTGPNTTVSLSELKKKELIAANSDTDILRMYTDYLDDDIVIKQPSGNKTVSEDIFKKFENEAEICSALDHDHIVELVDWGKQPFPWMGFEHMDGGSLSDRIESLSHLEGLWISVSVADAVWEAHTTGIAHLDIKPDNILFRRLSNDVWDVPKIGDWGVSKCLFDTAQDSNALSPRYAAPEQFEPEEYESPDNITDIYQLGTVVYEILTAKKIFTGKSVEVMYKHTSKSPTPPTKVDPTLPAAVDEVLATALSTRRKERYESMLDFRRDLESLFHTVAHDQSPTLICGRGNTDTTTDHRESELETVESEVGAEFNDSTANNLNNFGNNTKNTTLWNGNADILEQLGSWAESERKKEVPWQYRDDPPGMNSKTSSEDENSDK